MHPGQPPDFLNWTLLLKFWLKYLRNGQQLDIHRVKYEVEPPNERWIGELLVYTHPEHPDISLRAYDLLNRGIILALWGFTDDIKQKNSATALMLDKQWYILDAGDRLNLATPPLTSGQKIEKLTVKITEAASKRQTEIMIERKN